MPSALGLVCFTVNFDSTAAWFRNKQNWNRFDVTCQDKVDYSLDIEFELFQLKLLQDSFTTLQIEQGRLDFLGKTEKSAADFVPPYGLVMNSINVRSILNI